MPVAEKFKALGAGNGFPFCPTKIKVSNYDKWTTFSGYNSDSQGDPTQAQIDESFALAVKLLWNLASCEASASATTVYCSGLSAGSYSSSQSLATFANHARYQPRDRVNGTPSYSNHESSAPNSNGLSPANTTMYFNVAVVRMYNGATDNEDNFIGYGAGQSSSIDSRAAAAGKARTGVTLHGYYDAATPSSGKAQSREFAVVSGFHFVCTAYANFGNSGSGTASAENKTATATVIKPCENGSDTWTATSSIDSFNFFTYPA
jgi:hypothetical protein